MSNIARNVSEPQPHDRARLEWVQVDKLIPHPGYQRSLNETRLRGQFAIWSDDKCEALTIAPNGDGTYNVIEGQHRAVAAQRHGVLYLPARIVNLSYEEQAELWDRINTDRRKPDSFAHMNSQLKANSQVHVAITETARRLNITIDRSKRHRNVSAIQPLEELYEWGGQRLLEDVLTTLLDAWPSSPATFRKELLRGCGRLLHKTKGIDQKALSMKLAITFIEPPLLIAHAAANPLNAKRRDKAGQSGVKGGLSVARVMLNIYNKGRRTHIVEDTLE